MPFPVSGQELAHRRADQDRLPTEAEVAAYLREKEQEEINAYLKKKLGTDAYLIHRAVTGTEDNARRLASETGATGWDAVEGISSLPKAYLNTVAEGLGKIMPLIPGGPTAEDAAARTAEGKAELANTAILQGLEASKQNARAIAEQARGPGYAIDRSRDENLTAQLASGLGSLPAAIASGPAAPAVVAGMMGAQGARDARESLARRGITDPAEIQRAEDGATLVNAVTGLISEPLLGAPAMLKSVRGAGSGLLAKAGVPAATTNIARAAQELVKGAVREGVQEGIEQISQNLGANTVVGYDPGRKTSEGVAESAALGALIGAPTSAAFQIAQDRDSTKAHEKFAAALDTAKNVPESEKTLWLQQDQLKRGLRPAQMFPKGTEELGLPETMKRVETERGVFHYNPAQVTAEQIKAASANGEENLILGLGPVSKPAAEARAAKTGEALVVTTERAPDGTEIKSAVGTTGTAAAQAAALKASASPGSTVTTTTPGQTIIERLQTKRAAETAAARATLDKQNAERTERQAAADAKKTAILETMSAAREWASDPAVDLPRLKGAITSLDSAINDDGLGLTLEQRNQAAALRKRLTPRYEELQLLEDAAFAQRRKESQAKLAEEQAATKAKIRAETEAINAIKTTGRDPRDGNIIVELENVPDEEFYALENNLEAEGLDINTWQAELERRMRENERTDDSAMPDFTLADVFTGANGAKKWLGKTLRLPTAAALRADGDPLAGDMELIQETLPFGWFVGQAISLDTLAETLRGYGFSFQTPGELLEALRSPEDVRPNQSGSEDVQYAENSEPVTPSALEIANLEKEASLLFKYENSGQIPSGQISPGDLGERDLQPSKARRRSVATLEKLIIRGIFQRDRAVAAINRYLRDVQTKGPVEARKNSGITSAAHATQVLAGIRQFNEGGRFPGRVTNSLEKFLVSEEGLGRAAEHSRLPYVVHDPANYKTDAQLRRLRTDYAEGEDADPTQFAAAAARRVPDVKPQPDGTSTAAFAAQDAAPAATSWRDLPPRLTEAEIDARIEGIRSILPKLAKILQIEVGDLSAILSRARKRYIAVPGNVDALATTDAASLRPLIAFSAEAASRDEITSLFLHEIGHLYWDIIPSYAKDYLRQLHEKETRTRTGPLFNTDEGRTKRTKIKILKEEFSAERLAKDPDLAVKEWFCERIAAMNRDWLAGRMPSGAPLLTRLWLQFKDFLAATFAGVRKLDPESEVFERAFRQWLRAGDVNTANTATAYARGERGRAQFATTQGTMDLGGMALGIDLPDTIRNLTPKYQDKTVRFESNLDKALYYAGGEGQTATKTAITEHLQRETGLSPGEIATLARELRRKMAPLARSTATNGTLRVAPQMQAEARKLTGVSFAEGESQGELTIDDVNLPAAASQQQHSIALFARRFNQLHERVKGDRDPQLQEIYIRQTQRVETLLNDEIGSMDEQEIIELVNAIGTASPASALVLRAAQRTREWPAIALIFKSGIIQGGTAGESVDERSRLTDYGPLEAIDEADPTITENGERRIMRSWKGNQSTLDRSVFEIRGATRNELKFAMWDDTTTIQSARGPAPIPARRLIAEATSGPKAKFLRLVTRNAAQLIMSRTGLTPEAFWNAVKKGDVALVNELALRPNTNRKNYARAGRYVGPIKTAGALPVTRTVRNFTEQTDIQFAEREDGGESTRRSLNNPERQAWARYYRALEVSLTDDTLTQPAAIQLWRDLSEAATRLPLSNVKRTALRERIAELEALAQTKQWSDLATARRLWLAEQADAPSRPVATGFGTSGNTAQTDFIMDAAPEESAATLRAERARIEAALPNLNPEHDEDDARAHTQYTARLREIDGILARLQPPASPKETQATLPPGVTTAAKLSAEQEEDAKHLSAAAKIARHPAAVGDVEPGAAWPSVAKLTEAQLAEQIRNIDTFISDNFLDLAEASKAHLQAIRAATKLELDRRQAEAAAKAKPAAPAMPKPDRKTALVQQWKQGKLLRAQADLNENQTAWDEAQHQVTTAKRALDDEYPGWEDEFNPPATAKASRPAVKDSLTTAPTRARADQVEQDDGRNLPPPAPPEPTEKGAPAADDPAPDRKRANEVFFHSATTARWWEKSWSTIRDVIVGFRGAIPELQAFPDTEDRFVREKGKTFYNGLKAFHRTLSSANDSIQHTAEEQVAAITNPLMKLGGRFNADAYKQLQRRQAQSRRLKAEGKPMPAGAQAEYDALVLQMESHPYYLFNRLVFFMDLDWRYKNLKDGSGNPIKQPGGMNETEIANELKALGNAIAASPHAAAIETAYEKHTALVKQISDDLKGRDLFAAEALNNPVYFPHIILQTTRGDKVEERRILIERVRVGTEADFRGYLQDPVGSTKPIESDYANAMYSHLVQVGAHNLKADALRDHARPYDIRAEVEKRAKELSKQRGHTVDWMQTFHEEYEPRGYVIYGTDSRDAFPSVNVDREKLARRLGVILTGEDLHKQLAELGLKGIQLLPEDLKETLMQGQREMWVVPARVAEALRGIADRQVHKAGHMDVALKAATGWWKKWKLYAPQNHVRYEYGNVVADLEKLFSASPRTFRKLPQAAKELRAFYNGEAPSDDLRAALKDGVINAITAQEMDQLSRLRAFDKFQTKSEYIAMRIRKGASAAISGPIAHTAWAGGAVVNRMFGGNMPIWSGLGDLSSVELSAFREGVTRYANYLSNLDAIRNGARPDYAGAYHLDIEALQDSRPGAGDRAHRQAAQISKATFGDYGDLSVTGQWLRDHMIPLYSWMEVNFKYHANLFRNNLDLVRGKGTTAKGVTATARQGSALAGAFVARLAVPYVMIALWNAMMSGVDDDELSEEDRRRVHIRIGHTDEGKPIVIYGNTALADVMKWVSGPKAAQAGMMWLSGKTDFPTAFSSWASEIPGDLLNNIAGGFGPLGKIPYALASKKATFPDVTDQRTISDFDMRRHIIGQITDEFTADQIERLVNKDYSAPKDYATWAMQLILQMRQRDPESWAFYSIKDKAAAFIETRTGQSRDSSYNAPDQQVLRNFRRAIYQGDPEQAAKFYLRLLDLGYTSERFAASIRAQDPLSALPKESGLRREFVASLRPDEQAQLKRAYAYYTRMSTERGAETALFPSKQWGERGQQAYQERPRIDILNQTMQRRDQMPDAEVLRRAAMELQRSLSGPN